MDAFRGFYFNTDVILVDDNQSFLELLQLKLLTNHSVETYCDPHQAIESINAPSLFSAVQDVLIENDYDDDEVSCGIDFQKIRTLVQKYANQKVISAVIVDYSMPEMNGLQFCESIAKSPSLKMMLTGNADYRIAVDAFNKGIIDKFLVKDSPEMVKDILKNLDVMQNQFFASLSSSILSCLSVNKHSLIHSPEYRHHFDEIISQLRPKEYYIIDGLGSYYFLTPSNGPYYFMVFPMDKLEEFTDVAKNMGVHSALLQKLSNKTHAPVFINDSDWKLPVTEWDKLLYPIEKKEDYYFSLFPSSH